MALAYERPPEPTATPEPEERECSWSPRSRALRAAEASYRAVLDEAMRTFPADKRAYRRTLRAVRDAARDVQYAQGRYSAARVIPDLASTSGLPLERFLALVEALTKAKYSGRGKRGEARAERAVSILIYLRECYLRPALNMLESHRVD